MSKANSFLFFIVFSVCGVASATQESYQFESEAERIAFKNTLSELRCPKCQNQNIADSDAPIAQDIKRKVYQKIRAGEAEADIVDYLVERYGDFVRYRPRLAPSTYLLWFGPPIMVIFVLAFFVFQARRFPKQSKKETGTVTSSDQVDKAVTDLLSQYDKKQQENTPK